MQLQLSPSNSDVKIAVVAGVAVVSSVYLLNQLRKSFENKNKFHFPVVPSIPFVGCYRFFYERYDFIKECTERYGPFFQFYIAGYHVFHFTGPEARQFIFSKAGDRHTVNMGEGYKMFLAATPSAKVEMFTEEERLQSGMFLRRLSVLTSVDRLNKHLPVWLKDLQSEISSWGSQIEIDPFDKIYNMIFLLTIRTLFADEVANNPVLITQLSDLYLKLDQSAGYVSNLVPWLPSKKRRYRTEAVTGIYMMIAQHYAVRQQMKAEGKPVPQDGLQYMIDSGDSIAEIMQFITGSLFAGVVNTGMQSAWNVMYLSIHREWISKIMHELQLAVQKRSENVDPKNLDLSVLPVDAWDKEMPVLSACIAETNRLITGGGTLLRRVMGDGVEFKGVKLPKGSFLSYSVADCHFSKELFGENPHAFNPNNFMNKSDDPILDSRKPFDYLGWGAGRHPCAGMRMAKLELKMVVATFLTKFTEIEIVGSPNKAPEIDLNDNAKLGVPLKPVTLRVKV